MQCQCTILYFESIQPAKESWKNIKSLQLKAEYYHNRVERLAANEEQNKEIGQLVDLVLNSQDGQTNLSNIFFRSR